MSELHDLAAQGRALPPSTAQVEAFELLARRADELHHPAFAVWARQLLFSAANRVAMPERMIDAYTWMRGVFDREPQRVERDWILSAGALVVDSLDPFPEISRERILALYEDQEALHRREGESLRALHGARMSTELAMRRLEEATRAYEAWTALPRDALSGCAPCEQSHRASYLLAVGRDDEALELCAPLLDGRMTCDNAPFSAMADALKPLARAGRIEEARSHHRKGSAEALARPPWLRTVARHVTFGALDGAHEGALRLVEKMLPGALTSVSKLDPLFFYLSVLVLLREIGRGAETVTLRTPASFPLHARDDVHEVRALAAWVEGEARELARRFDARNGNRAFTEDLDALPEARQRYFAWATSTSGTPRSTSAPPPR